VLIKQYLHLIYHELRGPQSAYSYVLETSEFAKQVEMFRSLQHNAGSELRPVITFDDGHISGYESGFPLLEAAGLKAHFFITTGWTNAKVGFMGWSELRALHSAGQHIGAHGWTHTLLTHCDEVQLKRELLDARLLLEDKLGAAVTTMSLPGGRYNQHVLRACLEAGYSRVYSSTPKAETAPLGAVVGRFNIRGDMSVDWIKGLLEPDSATLRSLERKDRLKSMAKSILGDTLYAKLWAMVNRQEADSELE
jgi:peptidoglycan/xylan/chitin deacetylase (PgdA/CDA1 family)